MDINSLGAAYLNDMVLGTSMVNQERNMVNNLVNREKTGVNSLSGFEDMLRKAAAEKAADNAAPQTETASEPSVMQAANAPNGKAAGKAATATIDKTSKLYEQCLELEIFMVKTLISSMRNTVQKSGLIDEGFAGKMYEDMLYDEYARKFTENANFGMAEMAYLELTGQRGKVVIRQ